MHGNNGLREAERSSRLRMGAAARSDGERTCRAVLGTSAAPPAPACAAAKSEAGQAGHRESAARGRQAHINACLRPPAALAKFPTPSLRAACPSLAERGPVCFTTVVFKL